MNPINFVLCFETNVHVFSLRVNKVLEEKRMLVFQTLAQPSWKTFLFSHQARQGWGLGAPTRLTCRCWIWGGAGVLSLWSLLSSLPAAFPHELCLPPSSCHPRVLSLSATLLNLGFGQQLDLYPKHCHKNFIVPTFSSNSTLI